MTEKILFVDDEPNLLEAVQRQLRKKFEIETALSGADGLTAVQSQGPYAVVVSDMSMPIMNGVDFLAKVKDSAPNTVRVMLTGFADIQTAMDAVNEGHIFRFLTKPCPPNILTSALEAGVEQFRLITAEKQLLEETLTGAIRLLTEVLSMVNPLAFGRAMKVRESVRRIAKDVKIENVWELELAAMLSQVGYVTIPGELEAKAHSGKPLTFEEEKMLSRLPEIGKTLLCNIPRMQAVANIIHYQNKRFDGSGFPEGYITGNSIPKNSRYLKVILDLYELESDGLSTLAALEEMRKRDGWYDPDILEQVTSVYSQPQVTPITETKAKEAEEPGVKVSIDELCPGQVLMSDVVTCDNTVLLSAGHRISEALKEKILNYASYRGILDPIWVDTLNPDDE